MIKMCAMLSLIVLLLSNVGATPTDLHKGTDKEGQSKSSTGRKVLFGTIRHKMANKKSNTQKLPKASARGASGHAYTGLAAMIAATGIAERASCGTWHYSLSTHLSGYNNRHVVNADTIYHCKAECCEATDFTCRSFDWYRNEGKCDLSSETKDTVPPDKYKTGNHASNRWDHYELTRG
eukprot:CAMPEP_0119312174 /NCGR_PEP_ID=MMETSP1333-20130426/25357_1 /TAXON_ID=418940 /ORGANISM="Scyphosphaera apsteinii, Strain RCC1455" /LENGTH=178 /DNA_ID=CAMNT_0007316751 /DNA_START=52 /DNA_END=588 /DNA_ORIENTATION=+